MTLFCDLDSDARCSRCGRVAYSSHVRRECIFGLGDLVAAGLEMVGITKDRISALIGKDCGCAERQAWLNEVGDALRKQARFFGVN